MRKILLLFPALFYFCSSIVLCQSVQKITTIKHDLSFCNFQFREYEKEDRPYTLSFVEDTINHIRFDAYSTNLFDETFNPDNCTKKPVHFPLYQKKISSSDKSALFIFVNGIYVPIKENLDYTTFIPRRLSYIKSKGTAYLLFQLDNFSSTSSNYTRLSYTTILLKLKANDAVHDQFIYTSLKMEEPGFILKRYASNNKYFQ